MWSSTGLLPPFTDFPLLLLSREIISSRRTTLSVRTWGPSSLPRNFVVTLYVLICSLSQGGHFVSFLLCLALGMQYVIVDSKFGAQWPEQAEVLVL